MWFHPSKIFPPMILLIAYLLPCQDTVAAHTALTGLPSQRSRRQAGTPVPVNCRLGQWSQWTKCFPCQQKKHRYRTLQQPSKYKGDICTGNLWEVAACQPTETCAMIQDCGPDFRCRESGRCIKQHLVCNGEPDCSDKSDEVNCEDAESPCDDFDPIPGIAKITQGYNVLTQKRTQNLYDPKYYGGQCEYVYNGEWRQLKYDTTCERLYYGDDEKYFRKPYNVHFYQFLAHSDSGFSSESYDNSKDLLDALKRESNWKYGITFSIGSSVVPVGLNFGLNSAEDRMNLRNFTDYKSKNVQFIRVLTKVQTARFKMRRDDIVLDEEMLTSLVELPDQYNYGMYAKFINDYGTHFMTAGTMGGTFEYILVVNKDEMRRRGVTSEMVNSCFGASLGLEIPIQIGADASFSLSAAGKLSFNDCSAHGGQSKESHNEKSLIEDVIPRVEGGDAASIGRFMGSRNANAYRYWGRSLKLNPTVIDFELQPIPELLRRINLAHLETKRQNLKRALDEYLMEFNACRCGPCQNNGEPILTGSYCTCECPLGSSGLACENTVRSGRPVDGSWSCWAAWSPCQGGSQRRIRFCSNPSPQNGGMQCAGKNVQTQAC